MLQCSNGKVREDKLLEPGASRPLLEHKLGDVAVEDRQATSHRAEVAGREGEGVVMELAHPAIEAWSCDRDGPSGAYYPHEKQGTTMSGGVEKEPITPLNTSPLEF
ncbi:hypothetical protein LSTR_LSTR002641 [Laodelphax striatellus]|uniref:Uncharacterized protein n=1 Tax=Laodelphax striatellus TaxID=195883 RepID=A0A482XN55_LAOST|nr:hypothetical protein LSTR_LSTR002641 [Laodelphax striatellus]